MSEPEQGQPTYGPPPAGAYDQPWGPPAPIPPGAAHPPAASVAPQQWGYPPAAAARPYAAPTSPQGYPPQAPVVQAPVFTAPYAAPVPGNLATIPAARAGSGLGIAALILAALAFVIAPIIGAIAGYNIGVGVGHEIAVRPNSFAFDLSVLAPVRGWVLVGEIAFWAGTVLGVWALVQGIIALVKNRGRGAAIAAVIIAVLAPIAFGVAVNLSVVSGLAAGSALGS